MTGAQMDVLERAVELGALINNKVLCLPAKSVAKFLEIAIKAGWNVRYVECLYFHEVFGALPGGTEPSMELSCAYDEFPNADEFIAAVGVLASEAIDRALKARVRPYFEVGMDPQPNLTGRNIQVRR